MMKNWLHLALFAGLIASCVSLKCFSCMSSREGNCVDETQMETKECDSSGNSGILSVKAVCMKVVKEIRGFDHVTRSCGFEGSLIKPCDAHMTAEHCSLCDSNLCNSSKNLLVNYSLLPLSLAITIKYLVW